jgi:hypothetical protein
MDGGRAILSKLLDPLGKDIGSISLPLTAGITLSRMAQVFCNLPLNTIIGLAFAFGFRSFGVSFFTKTSASDS